MYFIFILEVFVLYLNAMDDVVNIFLNTEKEWTIFFRTAISKLICLCVVGNNEILIV